MDFLSRILTGVLSDGTVTQGFRSNYLRGFSIADFLSNIILWIFFRIFFRGFSFDYSIADFLSNILSQIFFFHIWKKFRGFFLTELLPRALLKAIKANTLLSIFSYRRFSLKYSSRIFFRIFFRGFSFKYYFADFLSNFLFWIFFQILFRAFSFKYGYAGPYKNQVTGVLSYGTVTQGFTKSNSIFITLVYFLAKEIFAQTFIVDFLSNIYSRILFREFSFKYSFADFFEYSFPDFRSKIFSRIFVRIFFCWFFFKNGYAGSYKKLVGGALFDGTVTYGFTRSIGSFTLFSL